ncbi:wax ester/triacylglycerol synthase family O-acyltransferase [Mycobacterium sp.]|uniref:WS/DGAT/MGAT family O-acyltransferase n=1 Tax=Mycobacterium sp. TaxID=1785 RepID=UPI002D12A059|nr:wax ester/triacylglycerol synthase family O-acyltransferase [Mycobacterium sp.]HXB88391.1 wax ester/triacylglycerol synthase family O-acyltransferase [Mycobacterium sp.]
MKRLSGTDALLLYVETPNVHTHSLKVSVFDTSNYDGEFGVDAIRRVFGGRLHLLDPLRYQLVDIPYKLHHPMWLEHVDVDLNYHIRRCQVPAPGGRRELDQVIGEAASTPLDRGRPLWEAHVVEGMTGHRVAVIGKIHHALADGLASANLLARAVDSGGPHSERDSYLTDPPVSSGQLLRAAGRDHLKQLRRLPGLVKDTATGVRQVRRNKPRLPGGYGEGNLRPPATFMNHALSPQREFASTTVALAEVKQTSKKLGVSLNDLILAMSTGALRELLLRYDGRANEPIITQVPVGLDKSPDRISGNVLGALLVALPVHVTAPLDWVRLVHLGVTVAKETDRLRGPELFDRWTNYLPPAMAESLFHWLASRDEQKLLYNVVVSNVPGPRQRVSLGGVPVTEFYSVGPVLAGCGLNITVWSYVDQVNISVLADRQTVGDPHEVTDAMVTAFGQIRSAAGLSPVPNEVGTAMPR